MFATVEDWAALPGNEMPSGDDLARLQRALARADRKVALLTRTAVYRHDALGTPIDSTVADALRDATLAQLEYGQATDPDGYGLGEIPVTVGPVTLGGTASTSGTLAEHSPDTVDILRAAGLLSARVGAF